MARRMLIAGNWKMNGRRAELSEIDAIAAAAQIGEAGSCELLVSPPATLLMAVRDRLPDGIRLGAQNCHHREKGAHTGDLSAAMLKDAGADHVILGHSERRTDHRETNAAIRDRVEAALKAELCVIVCVGESEEERDAGRTLAVLETQLAGSVPDVATSDSLVVAYEPVWAIGTGKTPTPDDVAKVHAFLREKLADRFGPAFADAVRILYGGSVKPANAPEFFAIADVDGALVGGASLKAAEFLAIARQAPSR